MGSRKPTVATSTALADACATARCVPRAVKGSKNHIPCEILVTKRNAAFSCGRRLRERVAPRRCEQKCWDHCVCSKRCCSSERGEIYQRVRNN